MKKNMLAILFAAALPQAMMAQWTDVTNQMLLSPAFDNNSAAGWNLDFWGNCNLGSDALESFNGWFDFSQTVSAPAGEYRLSCQAYYRQGSHQEAYAAHIGGTEEILPVLYANGNTVPVPSIYDYYSTGEFAWWGGWYEVKVNGDQLQYPDNMSSGAKMFGYGHYGVTLEFKHDGGSLTMGVKNNSEALRGEPYHYDGDWCMMDNFCLEYKGKLPKIPVEAFGCYDETLNLMPGDSYTLITYVLPTNATERGNIAWTSSNEKVVTVDKNGVVKAVADGTATITGTCDGKKVTVSVSVKGFDETGKAWADVTDEYMAEVDMTSGFEHWNRTPSRLDFGAAEFWNQSFDFYQELELPEGYYRFSCQAYWRPTDTSQEAVNTYDTNTNIAYIYAGGREVPIVNVASGRVYSDEGASGFVWVYAYNEAEADYEEFCLPNSMEAGIWCFENGIYPENHVVFYAAKDEKVHVGLRCNNYVSGQWCLFDNFRLERLVELVATTSVAISGDNSTMIPGETRQLAVEIKPANATYQTVLWSSSNEDVLTVDRTGLVTAVAEGTATVTAAARDNDKKTSSITITVKDASGDVAGLVINEVMSMNVDQFLDPSFNYGGWIELYNPTSSAISLKNCHITENKENLTEHNLVNAGVVPAKGFYTIWFDHCDPYFPSQVDFKLGTGGDWIAVTSPSGEIMAEIDYPAGVQRCSWARKTDGGSEWGYTAQPTPGKSNATSKWATKRLDAPEVDVPGQIFSSPLTVKVTWPKGATLRYTTDGTAPTATNGETSTDGVFSVENTTRLRVAAVQDGMLPSAVVTNTYIKKSYDFTIPVLSVTASQADLYGADHGIFVRGNGNGRTGNGQSSKCNWNQDWDRPCTFEYYDTDGTRTFMQDVDITAAGGWSRAWEPHSFKLKAAKVYGLNSMDYPFFDSKPYLKHKALQIRNGGNDNGCRFKDAALQTIIQRSGIYVDGQAYQPVAHYINGRYVGVINMREPNNKHHAYANYGYDTDFLDQFEMSPDSGWICKTGDREAYDELLAMSEDAADDDVYQTICNELLDIDEYINYMACWLWLGNSDWMRNNVKAYRSTETDGKFHYVMFDTDGAFYYSGRNCFTRLDGWNKTLVGCDYIYDLGTSLYVPFENVDIWFNLLQNDGFRKHFVDAYSLVCGSVFEATRCSEILDELYNRVQPMMQLNGNSSASTYNSLKSTLVASRNRTNINGMAQYWAFADETVERREVTFSSNVPEAGILYNGQDVPTGKFTGTAFMPVTLTACVPGGYDFAGWVLKNGSTSGVSTVVVPFGSTWAYYDQGSLDGESWMEKSYDDSSWSKGEAPLGYDDGSSAQGVGGLLATNSLKKGVAFYFRNEFNLAKEPAEGDKFSLDVVLDDGCVVYVNGQEAARNNMPNGEIGYNTVASTYAQDNPNRVTLSIPAKMLHKGKNVIAVEVHNNSATSSDICWDGALKMQEAGQQIEGEILSTDLEFNLDAIKDGSELVATYKPHVATGNMDAVPPVRINEVSAANETFACEYFKRNDWIELYNTTDKDVDVAGMYITDNVTKPTKFQIPTQLESGVPTVIPAHGYMVIWCDKLAPISQQHASFKLAAEASEVMLTAADQSWSDYLNYPEHDRNHTAGRYPDGSDEVYLLTVHTPDAANKMSSYAEAYELLQHPGYDAVSIADSESELGLRFDGRCIVASQKARIDVCTTAGEVVLTVPAASTVDLSALRPGIYVARAKAENKETVLKFSKRN